MLFNRLMPLIVPFLWSNVTLYPDKAGGLIEILNQISDFHRRGILVRGNYFGCLPRDKIALEYSMI
jgi:hypothetical protein